MRKGLERTRVWVLQPLATGGLAYEYIAIGQSYHFESSLSRIKVQVQVKRKSTIEMMS